MMFAVETKLLCQAKCVYTFRSSKGERRSKICKYRRSYFLDKCMCHLSSGWQYKMEASFVEIYNEEIRDLLATERGLKYEIKRVDSKSTDIYVTNLITEEVTCGSNVNPLLRRAKKNRAVAATNCNERSSR